MIQYKFDIIDKPGDALLNDEDWKEVRNLCSFYLIYNKNFN